MHIHTWEQNMNTYNLKTTRERELFPGFFGKFIHTDYMTLVYWSIEADSPLPAHSHPHEQVINMLEGQFEISIGDDTRILGPGEVAVIPGNAEHSGRAVTRCKILDVFYPIRQEYIWEEK